MSVSKFCLGAMMFGAWGNPDHDESIRIIHAALDAGINFIDTADVYGQGESEEIVGKALAGGRRDDVILATKFHNAMGEDPNERGNSRRWIMRAVEDSLRRLGTDWIDLYQVHRLDPQTDIEETLSALSDLVHQGKVRYIGSSTFPASQIVEAQWVARDRHLQRFVTEQPPYSILVRAAEADVLPTCLRHRMAVMSYSPLTGGWLSGRWRKDTGQQSSSRANRLPERFDLSQPANQRKLDAVEDLAQLAEQTGITLIQLAIAFVLNHPAITAALIGPRTMEQLESQLTAADVVLDEAVLDRIDEIVPPGTTINPADNPSTIRRSNRLHGGARSGRRVTVALRQKRRQPTSRGAESTNRRSQRTRERHRPDFVRGLSAACSRPRCCFGASRRKRARSLECGAVADSGREAGHGALELRRQMSPVGGRRGGDDHRGPARAADDAGDLSIARAGRGRVPVDDA